MWRPALLLLRLKGMLMLKPALQTGIPQSSMMAGSAQVGAALRSFALVAVAEHPLVLRLLRPLGLSPVPSCNVKHQTCSVPQPARG